MKKEITGEFIIKDNKEYYKISNYDESEPFFFNIATSGNIVLNLSSYGGIMAWRGEKENSLFPIIDQERMYHSEDVGVKTLVKVKIDSDTYRLSNTYLWQPFLNSYIKQYQTERNIYKSILGNGVILEELNHDLQLVFRYKWETSEKYGIVRSAMLENFNKKEISVDVCDGILNILPADIHKISQDNWFFSDDAYKKAELSEATTAATFSLNSPIDYLKSPEVSLKTNVVFCKADFDTKIYLNERVLQEFSKNTSLTEEKVYCGEKSAYILNFQNKIPSNKNIKWNIIADVSYDHVKLAQLLHDIKENHIDIEKDIEKSEQNLRNKLARADGLQCTGDKMSCVHHLSNINMQNKMIPEDYSFSNDDFLKFVKEKDKKVYEENIAFFEDTKNIKSFLKLKEKIRNTGPPELIGLCYEYIPIRNGKKVIENYEAICVSFPEFLDNLVVKVLNKITPYGIDEHISSFLRLLELLLKFNNDSLKIFIQEGQFPIEIEKSDKRRRDYLPLTNGNGSICYVSFAEKLIIPVLSRISNLVIGGGICMEIQNTEVKNYKDLEFRLSVVGVYRLKRYLSLIEDILTQYQEDSVSITSDVLNWLKGITDILKKYQNNIIDDTISGDIRMKVLKELGYNFNRYKETLCVDIFKNKIEVEYKTILEFLRLSQMYIDYTIKKNKRKDGLYHSYNIMYPQKDEIGHLKEMLEGQVAIIGCDYLSQRETTELLQKMEKSKLYSKKDKTYYRYPVVYTSSFVDKNIIPREFAVKSRLIQKLVKNNNEELVKIDCNKKIHFNEKLNSYEKFKSALETLTQNQAYKELVMIEEEELLKCYREVFNELTDITIKFSEYEGIETLLLNIWEKIITAKNKDDFKTAYRTIRSGLGFKKTPKEWCSFPQNAYSHTSFERVIEQLGEKNIMRFAELGIIVKDSRISFCPNLIDDSEFLSEKTEFEFIRIDNERELVSLDKDMLAFTFCQTPVIYQKSDKNEIFVLYTNAESVTVKGNTLPEDISKSVFMRENKVDSIRVYTI